MESERGGAPLFVDVCTRAEVGYVGIADAVGADIPVRLTREDYARGERP